MNHLDKDIAIRTLLERRITEHAEVIPTRYLSFGFRRPWIYMHMTGHRVRGIMCIKGLHRLSEATVRTVGAYTRK